MTPFTPNIKILYVDDEEYLLEAFRSMMRKEDIEIVTTSAPMEVDALLQREGPFAMVLSDQRMPGMDGVAVLERVAERDPDTIRVLVTGFASLEDTVQAVNRGRITHYISKPWDDDMLRRLVREGIATFNLQRQNEYLTQELKEKHEAVKELLQGTLAGTTQLLADMLANINPEAAAQTERLRQAGKTILTMLPDVSATERWEALRAFDLFNVGIATLPAWITVGLNKHGLGSISRFPAATKHHLNAADLLKKIPRFEGVARIIRLQNKNYDGSGDPADDRPQGTDIPIGARILHILLDLDRQTTKNTRGRTILEQMGRHPEKYDTEIIRTLLRGSVASSERVEVGVDSVEGIRPGMVLLDDMLDHNGQILLRRGRTISEGTLIMVRHWAEGGNVVFPLRVQMVKG